MRSRKRLKLFFLINLLIIGFLVGYKVYLNLYEKDFHGIHARQARQLENRLDGKQEFSFAVVGNINNSVGIFERKIVPILNGSEVDFMISAGNAVSSGGEDKYRALYRTLHHLDIPYLLTVGVNEVENFSRFRFYKHFGPFFYSMQIANSHFIFLDSTDENTFDWQLHWLQQQLEQARGHPVFVFMGHPLLRQGEDNLMDDSDNYLSAPELRHGLLALFERYSVNAVFSANLHRYVNQQYRGTRFITTGGAGGLVLNTENSFYHFVRVTVSGDEVMTDIQRLDIGQHRVTRVLESIWFFIHSLFYVGYLNYILLLCLFLLTGGLLYFHIFVDRDYYPDYGVDPTPFVDRPKRVLMLTNNYLPFIGGVPLSIQQLMNGLRRLGHELLLAAPSYRDQPPHEVDVLRVPSLLALGEREELRIANIFSPHAVQRMRRFEPDIVHLHHPFWMGTLGLLLARILRRPAVFTYHTRLEHYAHYVPIPTPLFRNLVSHSIVKRFANHCDGVVVPTDSAEDYLRIIGVNSNIFVVPTGVEFERFQTIDRQRLKTLRTEFGIDRQPVLISVSRLNKEKNIKFMLEAIHELKQETTSDFKFLILGSGNQREELRAYIHSKGLQENVILVGAVEPDQIHHYYHLADMFVFASISETQGMVVLEAMAAGLPVVAVRASGIEDLIQDSFNGYKTPLNRSVWKDRITTLLQDEKMRTSMGENAREFARQHDTLHFAQAMNQVYAEVLATHASMRKTAAQKQTP